MNTKRLSSLLVVVTILAAFSSSALSEPLSDSTQTTASSPPPVSVPPPTGPDTIGLADPRWETWEALPSDIQAKVDPRLLAELRGEVIPAHLGGGPEQADVAPARRKPVDKTRFLVHLKAKADLSVVARQHFTTRLDRRTFVFDALVSTAQATQGAIKATLDARMSRGHVASYQPFYIFNGLGVEGDLDTIIELARRDDVERIVANYPLVPLWDSSGAAASPANDLANLHSDNWNIDLVDADRVWDEFGLTGEGAVVGGIDTGVAWTHPALQSRYRGYNAGGPGIHVHDYNWFDPDGSLYPSGNLGASRSTAPFDYGEHGTHTMGTMVGDGGTSGTQVGMAPGARWVAISLNELYIAGDVTDDITANKAFQWMMCPTDLTGQLATADCSKAPDVVNNSWGNANPADDTLRPAIQALRAAGIAPVFASGNPSAGPGSIGSPGSIPEAITVGATDNNDFVASFSGRGPSFYEGEQKPELTAPGVNINSTLPGGGYSGPIWSGTSMAAPHVAGLIALMVSADLQDGYGDLDVGELERFMEYTAIDLGVSGPDDDYGWGRIDAYNAVRWARAAGDLRGTVTDKNTGAPIEGATVTGIKTNPGDTFTADTGATGQYSTTVPAGTYNISAEAWGYNSATFSGQMVLTGTLSYADLALGAMPTATLTGQVFDGVTPINGALVYVADNPAVNFTTEADGTYALALPVGTHAMVVEAAGYRIQQQDVSVASGGSTHDFSMTPAPTILLVDADTYAGWFVGWPVRNYFKWALDQKNYLYDVWEVQYTGFNDTRIMPDGSIGYGIPSIATLSSYDVVIWAHGGGNGSTTGSTVGMGADDELMGYLDGNGRLIISGQDLGYKDKGTTFYDHYLHAGHTMDVAAGEGATVSGINFLAGLNLEITNASLHGYANGLTTLSPDVVTSQDGAAFPAMTYDNGTGIAALAIAPCDADYRAVYLALGYENVAPRASNHDPDIARLLDLSIDWVMDTKPAYDVRVATTPSRHLGASGTTVTYDLQVLNTGAAMDTFTMSLSGNAWPTRILSGTAELATPFEVRPCESQNLTIEVNIPATANPGDEDVMTIAVTGMSNDSVGMTTIAFPQWQVKASMPTPRYRLAATNLPGDVHYYAIGGQGGLTWADPMNANERYNACNGQWESMAPMPTARGNIGAAVIDGQIYVPGGYATGMLFDVLEIYDPVADSWSSGAPMPEPLSGAAVAAYGGKLYVFGGNTLTGSLSARTYEYDPASNVWSAKSPMPGGGRAHGVAAELNGKIYVAGGWFVNTVEVYDPVTDSWSTAASMNFARQSPGMTTAPDGYLYVSGGGDDWWYGLISAERYSPATDTWTIIPSLNDGNRAGSASAYAAGQIFAIGGVSWNLSDVNESLQRFDTFCNSDKYAWQNTVQPGGRITYTVEIHSNPTVLTSARVADPIPAGTTFAGFGVNPVGATWHSSQVEWSGDVPAGSDPLTFTFGVDVAANGWTTGDVITNTATFDNDAGTILSRTASTVLDFADASPSIKLVDKDMALAGDVLTYTIHVENSSVISEVFTLRDLVPPNASYVPGSLTYNLGTGSYEAADDAVNWTGTLPEFDTYYVNTSGDYEWGDSDGNGAVPGVIYDWIDASDGSVAIGSYMDDGYAGPFGIGFTFNYYGTDYTQFYVNSNGSIQFGEGSSWYDPCPIDGDSPNNAIHLLGRDTVVDGSPGRVTYQTFGTAPNRYIVIEFHQLRNYNGLAYSNLEVILYEKGAIKLQYEDMDALMTSGTIGIDNSTGDNAVEYANACPAAVHDNLAVVFLPDGAAWWNLTPRADVTFAVATTAPLPVNTWITNTAIITTFRGTVERSVGTLVNPVELGTSTKTADKTQAMVGDVVTYDLNLKNTGLLTAIGATLNDPIPPNTTYVPGSVDCGSGTCSYSPAGDAVTWTGDIMPGGSVTLTLAVTLTTPLADTTPVLNTATLNNGYGNIYDLRAVFLARSSVLSASFKQVDLARASPGDTVTYTVYIHNTGVADVVAEMQDELPPQLAYESGSLVCGTGSCAYASGAITWTGMSYARSMVPVQFQATISAGAAAGDLVNTAVITDTTWDIGYQASATVVVSIPLIYFPIFMKSFGP